MGNISLLERVRNWIGEVAFDVFLWAVRMGADEYFDMIMSEGGLTPRALDGALCACPQPRFSVGNPSLCIICGKSRRQ